MRCSLLNPLLTHRTPNRTFKPTDGPEKYLHWEVSPLALMDLLCTLGARSAAQIRPHASACHGRHDTRLVGVAPGRSLGTPGAFFFVPRHIPHSLNVHNLGLSKFILMFPLP